MSELLATVKVKHPDTEGAFMIIYQSDFVEGVHELFEESNGSTPPSTNTAPAGLPEGTSVQSAGLGKFKALVGDATLKYPDGHEKAGKDVWFASEADAVAALQSFVAARDS